MAIKMQERMDQQTNKQNVAHKFPEELHNFS